MLDAEDLGVGAVNELIAYCPRLDAHIDHNDKTPITDGHIDVYAGIRHTNADLIGRVAVQVKGRAHQNKKIFKKDSTTFPVEREVLTFLRDDGGGIYFYVAIHPTSRERKIFYAVLNPFKLGRLIREMQPGQSTKNVSLRVLSDKVSDVERIVTYALSTKNQNLTLGFDDALLSQNTRFTIHSLDGLDLSRPSVLDLSKADYAVILHTEGGLSIPVDVDMEFFPPNYVEHERDIAVRCGNVGYARALVKQVDEETLTFTLSQALSFTLHITGRTADLRLEVASKGSLDDQISALDFFIAASDGQPLVIDDRPYSPSSEPSPAPAGLMEQRKRLAEFAALLDHLHIDSSLLDLSKVDDSQRKIMSLLHDALLRGKELHAADGGPGRFDLRLGNFTATLMAIPGTRSEYWRFFDVFDPANRPRFRLFSRNEEDELKEVEGTAYEGLTADELATTLNLRLDAVASAYEGITEKPAAYTLANHKVLHLIQAADNPGTPQREQLLGAAQELNEWLIQQQGPDSTHLINRWQILFRLDLLTESVRDEIRDLRRAVLRANTENADLIDACCALLLGDEGDVRSAVRSLDAQLRDRLERWPIWALSRQSIATAADRDVASPPA
jgi:hypothetical protein